MSDRYGDGTLSLFTVKRPKGPGWREVPVSQRFSMGYPLRAYIHERTSLAVMSAVEVASDEDKGPEYHVSISKQLLSGPQRCDSNDFVWRGVPKETGGR